MKRLSLSYSLIFITLIASLTHKSARARLFEKEILVTIEENRVDEGAVLKLHPLTTMSQDEKKRLCSAAAKVVSLTDFPENAELYTRLYKMKFDDAEKEGTYEYSASGTHEETSSAFLDNHTEELLKYTQLHKDRSHGKVISSRSVEERASLLANDHTKDQLRAHLISAMQLNDDTSARSLATNDSITRDSQSRDDVKQKDGKEADVPVAEGTTSVTSDVTPANDQISIPESDLEDLDDDYEEEVALVCPTTPVVHIGLGKVTDEIKIMFTYVFSVEAIHSITPISDDDVGDELRKNHLLTFEQEQLHSLCNITRKSVPIDGVSFKHYEIAKPSFFEIAYLPQFERPKRRDVVITCPLKPYTMYLRYEPPNEMKIMLPDDVLFKLLLKYGFSPEDIGKLSDQSVDESASNNQGKNDAEDAE